MPKTYRKRTTRRKTAKKTYRRKRTAPQRQIVTMGNGFPRMLKITHKYHDNYNLVATSGITDSHKFRCNGMYDPDYTGTGHQPIFFDQMTAIYNHYTVIASKITVTYTPSTATTQPSYVGLYVDDDATTLTGADVDALIEQNPSKVKITSFDANSRTIVQKWSAKKAFGGSVLNNSLLRGNAAGDPAEAQFFALYLRPLDNSSTVGIWCSVSIEYIAIWNELKTIAQS